MPALQQDAARSMSCPQVQMKSPSLFPSPDPYRHRRCAKLYNKNDDDNNDDDDEDNENEEDEEDEEDDDDNKNDDEDDDDDDNHYQTLE